eukprot:gene2636-5009_t
MCVPDVDGWNWVQASDEEEEDAKDADDSDTSSEDAMFEDGGEGMQGHGGNFGGPAMAPPGPPQGGMLGLLPMDPLHEGDYAQASSNTLSEPDTGELDPLLGEGLAHEEGVHVEDMEWEARQALGSSGEGDVSRGASSTSSTGGESSRSSLEGSAGGPAGRQYSGFSGGPVLPGHLSEGLSVDMGLPPPSSSSDRASGPPLAPSSLDGSHALSGGSQPPLGPPPPSSSSSSSNSGSSSNSDDSLSQDGDAEDRLGGLVPPGLGGPEFGQGPPEEGAPNMVMGGAPGGHGVVFGPRMSLPEEDDEEEEGAISSSSDDLDELVVGGSDGGSCEEPGNMYRNNETLQDDRFNILFWNDEHGAIGEGMNSSDLYPGKQWGATVNAWFPEVSAEKRIQSIIIVTRGGPLMCCTVDYSGYETPESVLEKGHNCDDPSGH